MKKIYTTLASVVLCTSAMFAQEVNENYVKGKIYFKLKNDVPIEAALKEDPMKIDPLSYPFLKSIAQQVRIKQISKPFNAAKESAVLQRTFELQLDDNADVDNVIRQLRASKIIEYAEKIPLYKPTMAPPNDQNYASQWALAKINAEGAWAYSTGSTNVTVAIVDEAVELNHPDLVANIWVNPGEIAGNGIDDDNNGYIDDINGYDVADNDNNPNPPDATYAHGTIIAGLAAASTNNNIGIASIGYKIKIIAVKSANSNGMAYGLNGIIYAAAVKANVINMSWGGSPYSATAQNVIDYAYSKGCVLVGAAGNLGAEGFFYPAAYNHVICVAATGSGDAKSSFSDYGTMVDVCAPGENIYSTTYGATYSYSQGTSEATPFVSGLCGLMLSLNPNLTSDDIEACLKSNADNIDAQNPSYIGKLGGGRINAAKTMQCVQTSLTWKPTADFTSNLTTVTAGGNVIFTDKSIHSANSWNWSFPGGSPTSYVGKIPPSITYPTPGTYNVTLVAGNSNGTDTKTKTGYINVTVAGGCDELNYAKTLGATPAWSPAAYGASATVPTNKDGYIVGLNDLDGDKQKAQYFDATSSPYTILTQVFMWVYKAYSTNLNKTITINVYDGTSGSPGALLGSATKSLQQCRSAVLKNSYLDAAFRPVINLPASKKFFISVDYSNLNWTTSKDTLAIVSNLNGQSIPSGIWEQKNTNTWAQMGVTGSSWNFKASMYMFPALTDKPVIAASTVTPTTICEGQSVSMDAAGSTFQDTLIWYCPGGNPLKSNAVSTTVLYNTAGNYITKLYIVGGGCHELDSTVTSITVNATPKINISSSNGTTFCSGNPTTLIASGAAGSYTWSPSTGLNTTSGSTVTALPSANVTYNVSAATAGCLGSTAINIKIDQPVSIFVTTTPVNATVCEAAPVTFNASLSTNVSAYTWNFPGGSPSTSGLISPVVTYASAGNFTATLSASNSCGTNSSYSQAVNVNVCTGVDNLSSSANVKTNYNALSKQLEISVHAGFNHSTNLVVRVVDLLGQVVYTGQLLTSTDWTSSVIDMSACSKGVYSIQLLSDSSTFSRKFIVH
jgi:serine protease